MDMAVDRDYPGQVIVVDDDPAVCNALKFAFQIDGYDVRTFDNAEQLLAARDLPARGCLVVDQRMPGIDGLDMIARLRAEGVDLPAVLITTPTSLVQRRAAAANIPIVEKPLLNSALVDQVRELIDLDKCRVRV